MSGSIKAGAWAGPKLKLLPWAIRVGIRHGGDMAALSQFEEHEAELEVFEAMKAIGSVTAAHNQGAAA